jgi:hypothetical protein
VIELILEEQRSRGEPVVVEPFVGIQQIAVDVELTFPPMSFSVAWNGCDSIRSCVGISGPKSAPWNFSAPVVVKDVELSERRNAICQ